jgi:chromosome segregation ATPase
MAETNAITAGAVGTIQHAKAEELNMMTEEVINVNTQLSKANSELELLDDALKQLSYTKDEYDKKSTEVRKRMQRLVTRL